MASSTLSKSRRYHFPFLRLERYFVDFQFSFDQINTSVIVERCLVEIRVFIVTKVHGKILVVEWKSLKLKSLIENAADWSSISAWEVVILFIWSDIVAWDHKFWSVGEQLILILKNFDSIDRNYVWDPERLPFSECLLTFFHCFEIT